MISIAEITKEYESLAGLPLDSDGAAKRRRGFAFERLLINLFKFDNLEPRAGYRPAGEQIDGSIYLDGRVYLLEAKWHADPLPASTLYQFKGKVDGKLAGTIGIFISMSGYAEDAVDALILGKGLNVILLDRQDMDVAILRGAGFKSLLKTKIRKAAEEGAIYFPSEVELVSATKTRTIDIDHLQVDQMTGEVLSSRPVQFDVAQLLIVCEGNTDRVALTVLVERILISARSDRLIKIVPAMGKITIPRVANALRKNFQTQSKVLIVTDADADPVGTATMLSNGLEFSDWVAAIPDPSIETWLGLDTNLRARSRGATWLDQVRKAAEELDIPALAQRDEQFKRFYDAVLEQ